MSRNIRRVPKEWKHPVDERGRYLPLCDRSFTDAILDHLKELPWYLKRLRYIKDWFEEFPDRAYCRPRFRRGTATCYQIYEEVSEGTPVSPIFKSLEEMKTWLLQEGYSEHAASMFVDRGWAPSMIAIPGRGISGTGIHSLDWLAVKRGD